MSGRPVSQVRPAPSARRRRPLRGAGMRALAGLAAVAAGLVGCDSSATIFPVKISFKELQVVSAYPAAKAPDGRWVRQCSGGDAEGLLLNVEFVSTQRDAGQDASPDRDLSIRPLDIVNFRAVDGGTSTAINLSSTGNFDLSLDCIDPLPDVNTGSCQGATASPQLAEVEYVAASSSRRAARDDGHNVIVLIDQSGSTSGLIDKDTLLEDAPNKVGTNIPPNFGQFASDQNNVRLTAAKRFISTLNDRDRVGVIAFGEGLGASPLVVPCANALGNYEQDLRDCFGRNHDLWTAAGRGIDALGGGQAGRSNMWQAVEAAYDFLEELADFNRTNHIVVITDGPDTCAVSDAFGSCQSACSTTAQMDVLERVEAAQGDPAKLNVRMHFVQFESIGYPGRDPRQMEVACASEGHYQFINSNDMSNVNIAAFQDALEKALSNVRFSLMGWWQLSLGVPAYASNSAAPTGTPPGGLYALAGTLTVKRTTNMVDKDQPFAFGYGLGAGAGEATNWDRRPSVRKPCGGPSDCGAAADAGAPCLTICSDDTLTCPGGAAGVPKPDTTPCAVGDGTTGFCCEGACLSGGQTCAACQ